jgi:two-component system phosphate regulon sensor histidine kinase PhoR
VGRSHLISVVIVATACAAGLMLYLQHRAITALRTQTEIILRQNTAQSARDVADELRRLLDGPVVDTLTAVTHPDLRAGRLDLVGEQFRAGLIAYPHVEEFFAWHSRDGLTDAAMLFYGRGGQLGPNPELARAVMALAREYAPAQQIYIAAPGIRPEQYVFVRLFWTDAARRDFFAILGFVVDLATLPTRVFGPPSYSFFETVLRRNGSDIPLRLTVSDERGVPIYGGGMPAPVSTRIPFAVLFYPGEDVHSRLAVSVAPRMWTIAVSADAPQAARFAWQGYGLTAVSLGLMALAFFVTLRAHRRLVELTDMQADFVAHVSHQLKTPLSLLKAAVETLQLDRVRSPDRLADYFATIESEVGRLSTLVQRVLECSRMQQRPHYEFERVDLGRLAHETVDAFANGLPERSFVCAPARHDPGPFVRADPAALEQVIASLLDNAVKYSEADTPILLRVATIRNRAIVEVIDQGIGIAGADLSRIFERFFRASNVTQRPGFGLGLTIVREVLDAHRGQISVTSEPGRGSTFRIALPLDTAEQPMTEKPNVTASEVRS